jgi:hypothetical protein
MFHKSAVNQSRDRQGAEFKVITVPASPRARL